jgi:hypothetical protein
MDCQEQKYLKDLADANLRHHGNPTLAQNWQVGWKENCDAMFTLRKKVPF